MRRAARRGARRSTGRSEGRVRDLGARGDAVVETAEGIVLVAGALPGERVRLRVTGRRAGVARGVVVEVLEPSPDRVPAPCAVADRCGGCPWMGIDLGRQRALKAARVATAVGLPDVPLVAGDADGLGVRARARLRFAAGRVGYRAAASSALVEVDGCAVLSAPLAAALAAVRTRLVPALRGAGEVHLALGGPLGEHAVAVVEAEGPQDRGAYDALAALSGEGILAGATLRAGAGTIPARFGDPTERRPGPDGALLEGPPGGFAQAHQRLNQALADHVVAAARPEGARVLELFAGHGNLTVGLAAGAASLVAVEWDADAAEACAANLARRGLGDRCRVRRGDAAAAVGEGERFDVVVLDPPRRGAGAAVAAVAAARPARVVYVSCEPSTLATDLRALAGSGLRPVAATAFDMFPHTPHVEAVVTLEPSSAPGAGGRGPVNDRGSFTGRPAVLDGPAS